MPLQIISATEKLPYRSTISMIYGEEGVGKTTLALTAGECILLDLEGGALRAGLRADQTISGSWEDIKTAQSDGTFRELRNRYSIIVVDTAEALLTHTIGAHLKEKDYRCRNEGFEYYGKMKSEFTAFLEFLKKLNFDIEFLAHQSSSKSRIGQKDISVYQPKMTGGSYDVLMSVLDNLGYFYIEGNHRVIDFAPSESYRAKDMAGIGKLTIPDKSDPSFRTFIADNVIAPTKKKMVQLVDKRVDVRPEQTQASPQNQPASQTPPPNNDAGLNTADSAAKSDIPPQGQNQAPETPIDIDALIAEKKKMFEEITDVAVFNAAMWALRKLELETKDKVRLFNDAVKPVGKAKGYVLEGNSWVVPLANEVKKEDPGLFDGQGELSNGEVTPEEIKWCQETIDMLRGTIKDDSIKTMPFGHLKRMVNLPKAKITNEHIMKVNEARYQKVLLTVIADQLEAMNKALKES